MRRLALSAFLLFWLEPVTLLRLPTLAEEEALMRRINESRERDLERCLEVPDIDPKSVFHDPTCMFKET
jgi:hypothetical protein